MLIIFPATLLPSGTNTNYTTANEKLHVPGAIIYSYTILPECENATNYYSCRFSDFYFTILKQVQM